VNFYGLKRIDNENFEIVNVSKFNKLVKLLTNKYQFNKHNLLGLYLSKNDISIFVLDNWKEVEIKNYEMLKEMVLIDIRKIKIKLLKFIF
jgi:hypothetical protein